MEGSTIFFLITCYVFIVIIAYKIVVNCDENDIGCFSWIFLIVGFPGMLVGEVAKDKKMKEEAVRQAIEIKNAEIATERKKQAIQREREEKIQSNIARMEKSENTAKILQFLQNINDIYKISIYVDRIQVYYSGGTTQYLFMAYGMKELHTVSYGYDKTTCDVYALGCALNNMMGNKYNVDAHVEMDRVGEGEYLQFIPKFKSVEMIIPLKAF